MRELSRLGVDVPPRAAAAGGTPIVVGTLSESPGLFEQGP